MTPLSGVWAASLTPLTDDLDPDVERLAAHATRLFASGCDGILLFGTTGEATSFSVQERTGVLDGLIDSGVDPGRVIVGVGCAAVTDTVELTRAAGRSGVAAVLMLPPFYYKAVSDDGLAAAFELILRSVADDTPPVLLYNIPRVSGVKVSAELAGRLARKYPGVVAGVKDSTGDIASLRAFLQEMPGCAVFAGTELVLVAGLEDGAVGTISALANLNASDIRTAYESRNTNHMPILEEARMVMSAHPLIPGLKAVMAERLEDPGWAAVRPPLRSLAPGHGAALAAALPGP